MKQKSSFLKALGIMLLSVLFATQANAQNLTVTGTVTDNLGPVIGASIQVEGTSNGCITDIDGNYSLPNVPANSTLVFSYIGYQTQKVAVNGKTKIDVQLAEDSQLLQEVVVVGYGVQRKSDLTGAVASVKAADALKATPTGNVSDALQGRMAGVSVLSGSGDPSSDNTIRVRGINSITAETGPLVVVDGFIGGSLKSLNPSDIASIEVLKDASATAVYGSRGANGVILVTTKNPAKDKLTVSFNAFANFKTVSKYPDTLSPYEFANLANDYAKEYFGGTEKPYYDDAQLQAFKNGTAGYDYARAIFRDPAIVQNYELSIAGGGEKTTFLASLRYENNQGVIEESESSIYNWRLKVDTKLKKWLKVGMNIYGYYNKSAKPRISEYDGLIQHAMYFPNTVSPQNEDGDYNNAFIDGSTTYNPMGHIWEANNSNETLNNRLQGYVNFDIIDGLSFRTQLGVNFENRLSTSVQGEKSYESFKNGMTQASAQSYWNMGWLNTNTLSYIKEFNENHRVNATAVFEQSYSNNYNHKGTGKNLDYPDRLGANSIGASQANLAGVSSSRTITTLMSGMFRVNYVFMNRYMLTASVRADGSSNLKDHWDYFPSAALAWDLKQENFLKDVKGIDQFKLRLGYGSVGNQAVSAYRYFSQMLPTTNSDGTTSYKVGRPKAEYLIWERNDQFNIGVDLGFMNGHLRLTGDWYSKLSKDILLDLAQPTHMGFSSLLMNSGEIKNTGVEFTISADPISNKDFSWHTDLTLSHNKGVYNKIPTYNKRQQQAGNYQNKLFQMIEGEKLGTFWGYTYGGVWQEDEVNSLYIDANGKSDGRTNGEVYKVVAGNSKYVDVNKDGAYNDADMKIIGCGQPTFNWGFSNNFTFKDFDFSLFIIGFHGFDIYNATHQMGYNQIGNMCMVTPMKDWLDRWTPTHTNTDVPGFVKGGTEKKDMYSTRFVENGSFVKVKNITLGYTLPEQVCKTIGISGLRVYASIQNPFQFTGYSGLDPEATMGSPLKQGVDWAAYPNSRNYLIGLNFSF
ncbi:TonB-dependent receptor [Bacteroides uniformis]|uniref:SusC/RagA family TonB-linked outer membrane protein n=1 Tax=Bacteroides uniformis TaxID=820 RepID=UPI00233F34F1|nr:TonB-dependent receptor [Bacteroides uniformis]MDC1811244.1 TonB-dependent receptor [Bacteroides uniformis]